MGPLIRTAPSCCVRSWSGTFKLDPATTGFGTRTDTWRFRSRHCRLVNKGGWWVIGGVHHPPSKPSPRIEGWWCLERIRWFFGKNQLGEDSTGLPGSGRLFFTFSMSLFKKIRILIFSESKMKKMRIEIWGRLVVFWAFNLCSGHFWWRKGCSQENGKIMVNHYHPWLGGDLPLRPTITQPLLTSLFGLDSYWRLIWSDPCATY